MERRTEPGLIGAIRIDLQRLHAAWMELIFPQQLDPGRIVGKWEPEEGAETVAYLAWAVLGAPVVGLVYPLLLAGFALRFYARKVDAATARIGLIGVLGVSVLAWGGLTAAAYLRNFPVRGLIAVGAAGLVATIAAGIALFASKRGGRSLSILVAYPAAVTAFLLPPVVAALYSPVLADVVFAGSRTFAIWLLDNVLSVGGIAAFLRAEFQLQGVAFVLMWFGIAVPLGWLFGLLIGLANVIRPAPENVSGGSTEL
jgi:hypothetical protein